MKKEIEREFNRGGGIRVPIEADAAGIPRGNYNTYNGPVVMSSGATAQIAFGDSVIQNQAHTEQVTTGYEALAEAVSLVMARLSSLELADDDRLTAEEASTELLTEITRQEPDRKLLRRGVAALKGVIAPVATGAAAGVGAAVNAEAQEWAHQALDLLQGIVF
jgi:hypothetical protein